MHRTPLRHRTNASPFRLVKVDPTGNMARLSAYISNSGETSAMSNVLLGSSVFIGTGNSPGRVAKVFMSAI